MKELSIEEKAKRYDEAIERAKSKIRNDKNHVLYEDDVIEIFPELKESGDERIRKSLIELFHDTVSNDEIFSDYGLDKTEVLAWLEKQGKQKPVDKVEPKFKVGDWVVQGCNILRIRCVGDKCYCYETVGGYVDDMLVSEIDSLYHLWTIKDAKEGDVLTSDNKNCPFIYKSQTQCGNPVAYCGVRSDGKFIENPPYDHLWCLKSETIPATKEQCKLLFQRIKEAGYGWNADKKELKNCKL